MDKQQGIKSLTLEELKQKWNSFAGIYSNFDQSMNCFFYQLVHMLKLQKGNNILEVGCGRGKLIPLAMSLKNRQTRYLAIDLSQTMIDMAKVTVREFLKTMPNYLKEQQYYEHNRLRIQCGDGQKQIQKGQPFDRIICNLVLMLTQDPYEMMRTFHKQATEGCLLGVTVTGNTDLSNYFLQIPNKIKKRLGIPVDKQKAANNHILNEKLQDLGNQTGWELMVSWQHQVPYPFFEVDQKLRQILKEWKVYSGDLIEEILQEIKSIFGSKQILYFPGKMAIFKKK